MANGNFITRLFTPRERVAPPPVEERGVKVDYTAPLGLPYSTTHSAPLNVDAAMQISTVYRCVEVISDAIASQEWLIKEYGDNGWVTNPMHDSASMLNYEPSPSMTRYTMMKALVSKAILEGDGYIEIMRDNRGDPVRLELINDSVTVYRDNKSGYLFYEVHNKDNPHVVLGENMIHILNFSYNGYTGVSTLVHATNSMNIAASAEASAKGFFDSGANASGVLTVDAKLTQEKADALKASWAAAFSSTGGTPGGVAVIEKGINFTPTTVNPQQAQMVETRQYNVTDLCRFFGLAPAKAFDDKNLTYDNVESFQLGFLTDTVSPWNAKIENEFNRKLFRPSQRKATRLSLNIEELLRADMDTWANYLSKLFQCGGYTSDEVRAKIGNPRSGVPGANIPMVQVNMIPVDKIGKKDKTPSASDSQTE